MLMVLAMQANGELVAGVEEQTRQALVNMGQLLQAVGCDHRHVVKTTVLLKDIEDFPAMNAVYEEFFREVSPARATFQVKIFDRWQDLESFAGWGFTQGRQCGGGGGRHGWQCQYYQTLRPMSLFVCQCPF